MKYIDIFVASSIDEFYEARICLGDKIRRINETCFDAGFQFRLHLCEDESLNVQSVYDRLIERSHIFIALVGSKLGNFTIKEIRDIADKASIRYKTIIRNAESPVDISQLGLASTNWNFLSSKDCVSETIRFIWDSKDDLLSLLPNETIYYCSDRIFKISVPKYKESLEFAIISNLIRRFRDESYRISLVDDTAYNKDNALLMLLSEDFEEENRRLEPVLHNEFPIEYLWVFHDIGGVKISDNHLFDYLCKSLGCYPDNYASPQELQLKLENKFLKSLIDYKDTTTYDVISHYLIERHSIRPPKIVINLSIFWGSLDSNEQSRRERIVINLLNYYLRNRLTERLTDALCELRMGNWDGLVSRQDIVDTNNIQNILDVYHEKLSLLIKMSDSISDEDLYNRIFEISSFPSTVKFFTLQVDDLYKQNITLGDVLFYRSKEKSLGYYLSAYEILSTLPEEDFPWKRDECFLCLNRICQICWFYNDIQQLLLWAKKGVILFENDSQTLYEVNFLIWNARAQGKGLGFSEAAYAPAINILRENHRYNNDNDYLSAYIQVRFEMSMEQFSKNQKLPDDYLELKRLCTRYLMRDSYVLEYAYVDILEAIDTNNLEECTRTINILRDFYGCDDHPILLYFKYIRTVVERRYGLFEEAIPELKDICEKSRFPSFTACCKQNIADCLLILDNYELAEKWYADAAELFRKDDLSCLGNTLDGMAWCCLLQNKINEAEDYSRRAVNLIEYSCANKYCNYISSLLLSDKKWSRCKAIYTFIFGAKFSRLAILKQLYQDWGDLDKVGVRSCFTLFVLQKIGRAKETLLKLNVTAK